MSLSLPHRTFSTVCLVLCLLFGSLLSARAGRIYDDDGTTVIELVIHNWMFPDASRTDPGSLANLETVAAFQKGFPEILRDRYARRYAADPERYGTFNWDRVEVRPRKFTGIRVTGLEQDLLAIAGGVAPDVFYINFRKSDTYIREGFLAPLDAYAATMPADELSDRIHPRIRDVVYRQGADGQEHLWALPYGGLMGRVLFFRKDRFDEAGLSYPDVQWTWDDLLHACRRLSDPAKGRYGIRLGRGSHEAWFWTSFLWSAGGDILHHDRAANRWSVVYDSPEAAVALDFYTTLVTDPWTDAAGIARKGYAYRDVAGAWDKWKRGEIAMTQGYVDEEMLDIIQPERTGMAPAPLGPGGIRGSEINSRMAGLYAGIEHPVIRDAAWEFIRFFGSEEAQRIKTRVLVESGYAAFVNPAFLERFGYRSLLRPGERDWFEVFRIVTETGKPEPYGPHSNIAYEMLSKPMQTAQEMAIDGELSEHRDTRLVQLQELLEQSAAEARRLMLGVVPDEQLRVRHSVALGVLLLTLGIYAALITRLARAYGEAARSDAIMSRRRHLLWVSLLLFPAMSAILVWQYLPLGRGLLMAFQDYRVMGGSSWTGLENLAAVLFDPAWWHAVFLAIRYTVLVVVLTFLPPLFLAILLQETPFGRLFFRTVYYLPAVVNGLVVILMWKGFYEESENGLLNALVMKIPPALHVGLGVFLLVLCLFPARRLWGLGQRLFAMLAALAGVALLYTGLKLAGGSGEPVRWLSDPDTAMLACVLPLAWAGMGPGCLVYLAALKGVSEEWYEAADLDGASFLDKVLFIVVPALKPLLVINFVGVFIAAFFHAEANILAMTGGSADTTVAGLHIFYQAFIYLKFGPATAMAWLLGVLLIGFTIYQLRMLANLEFKTTGGN